MADNIFIDDACVKQRSELYNKAFSHTQLNDIILFNTNLSIEENLDLISLHALDPKYTLQTLYSYKELLLDLVSRWIDIQSVNSKVKNTTIFCALASISSCLPQSTIFTEHFLQNSSANIPLNENTLLAYYRLIDHDIHKFKSYVQPEQLYDILSSTSATPVAKLLSIEILAMYLNASEEVRHKMIVTHVPNQDKFLSEYDGVNDIDYSFIALLESNRLSKFQSLKENWNLQLPTKKCHEVKPENLSNLVVSVCGELVPRILQNNQVTEITENDFVPTDSAVQVLREMANNIQLNKPTLLYGEAGSGKTYLINEMAKRCGYEQSIVKIHLGEQTDAKLLLGTYASGDKPGTFQWRAGVLTTAVQQGRWVIIEDIDAAPTEVLSVLLTLLEKKELSIPSRGEIVKAANGFQLIATIRSNKKNLPDMIGLRLWQLLNVPTPVDIDLRNILNSRFPIVGPQFIAKFIKCYNEIVRIYGTSSFISLNKGSHPRTISFRDLMKLCRRCTAMFSTEGITSTQGVLLQSYIYDQIFAEAVDCFGSAITERNALLPIINTIGEILEIPNSRIQLFLTKHVPEFTNTDEELKVGRAVLKKSAADRALNLIKSGGNFAMTNHSLRLMEQIGTCIQMIEPVLLVGETGTGKTTVVQQIAKLMNKKITVINVSQQTESGDLLGGYKPVNSKTIAIPLQEAFENLFIASFSKKKNEKFSQILTKCFNKGQWKNVLKLWKEAIKMAKTTLAAPETDEPPSKKRKLSGEEKSILLNKWIDFEAQIKSFELQALNLDSSFVFNFVEGSLVKAVRDGDWLLLDEINLASSDTLESISDLLTETLNQRSILLTERGDVEAISAHPEFRLFGCMNPSTDVGKKDLPSSIRSRFSEIYVHSPDSDINDLLSIIDKYIGRFSISDEWVGNDVAELYLEAKRLAESNQIVDGSNQKPHFSIRTLTRTLTYVCDIVSIYGLRRSLYEGFCMSYLTLLDSKSEKILHESIVKYTLGRLKNVKSVMHQIPPSPTGSEYVQFRHYWMKRGPSELLEQPHYIITPSVEKNMMNLVRATAGRRFPVLIQGPTSAGKTSMIQYLASITGHKFVRINNHEHTDLQEYLGTYISDSTGKLVFKEGILVEALRNGYWIVLDELNLAPTDVLEALNRLLDDNRELFIPETQEVIHPHPDFMLFATQNPPGLYGGRKFLSRAFRNRFLELHFDDIPQDELEVILRERCQIAPSYAKKIVEVYRQLSIQRQSNRLFEQKNSFATLRDLFRWALREAVGYEQLAANGYMLLAERVRKQEEKVVVKKTIEKVMKVKLDISAYYRSLETDALADIINNNSLGIVWTNAMRRLAVLVYISMKYNEPLLLVGETGCGKTTVCQIIAEYLKRPLVTVNAHQNTETGDILGAQRPARHRFEAQGKLFNNLMKFFNNANVEIEFDQTKLDELLKNFDKLKSDSDQEELILEIEKNRKDAYVLFEWSDGPLVQAMKNGDFFLLDEISLADDSVLERLNSVLEPERSLLLAEKGNDDSFIVAKDTFQFLATMNPGGDYGKKELSPALRNRFTEIWVPSMESFDDVRQIVASKLNNKILVNPLVDFTEWYGKHFGSGNATSGVISLRDILAWVQFINSCPQLNDYAALYHGASMVFIDALGTNNTAYLAENEQRLSEEKEKCIKQLSKLCGVDLFQYIIENYAVKVDHEKLSSGDFNIPRKSNVQSEKLSFNIEAPTTASNVMRVLRAMQVSKPILLEGSPGVGKTSLVTALAKATGNSLVRINLSEQTDLVDLFGSDAPAEGGQVGEFIWKDAPFLRAMQKGEWVLLDEMNLASQSVLEGLNACLDHRGSAYIPELDRTFSKHPDFVVFAAQNPQYQGGGRKGLPKSFVNRFSVVFVDLLKEEDLRLIASHLYPQIDQKISHKLIKFIARLEEEITVKKSFGHNGAPWEFNLRDTLRWLQLYGSSSISINRPDDFLEMVVLQRFRAPEDRILAIELYEEVFQEKLSKRDNYYSIGKSYVQAGSAVIARNKIVNYSTQKKHVSLQCNFKALESAIRCINLNLPLILTGPTNSGKTELVRFLADAVGAPLDEFAMNSDVDSMDILGGYEQVDLERGLTNIVDRAKELFLNLTLENLIDLNTNANTLSTALSFVNYLHCATGTPIERCENVINVLQQFIAVYPESELKCLLEDSITLRKKLDHQNSVRFEWFDGLLVRAVEKGHWLVLDNANLCSPSVLDRLNSLLETNGTLIINECSSVDGQPRTIKPHPNFRLFLTVDPKYGELSRAMRNRGIEVYLDNLDKRMSNFDKALSVSSNLSCQRSMERIFALIEDISKTRNASWSSVGLLNFNALPFVPAWKDSISKLNFVSKTIAQEFCEKYQTLDVTKLKSNYDQSLNDISWDSSFKNSYFENQTLHPLINSYLQQHATDNTSMYFVALAGLFEINQAIAQIETRALGQKVGELSYIELSAAFELGRNIKNPPKHNVYRFVLSIRDYIAKSCQIDDCMKVVKLQIIFKSLLDHYKLDISRLRVFQTMIKNWMEEFEVSDNDLERTVSLLGSEMSLKTGMSMSKLWETFRREYPTSAEGWLQAKKLFKLAEDFDNIAEQQFPDANEEIMLLKSSIANYFQEIISGNSMSQQLFEEFCNNLSNGIAQLQNTSNSFLIKRHNIFKTEFKYVKNAIESTGDCDESMSTTLQCLNTSKTKKFKPYPKLFDSLWKDNESLVSGLFTDKLILEAMSKVVNLNSTVAKNLNQILEDMILFGGQLIKFSNSILNNMKSVFKSLLVEWFTEILNAHLKEPMFVQLDKLDQILHVVSENESLSRICQEFFIPALHLIYKSDSLEFIGRAWVLFAAGAVQLYVPSSSYDPAIAEHVEFARFEKFKNMASELKDSWKSSREALSGDQEIKLETLLPLVSDECDKPRVYRPEHSSIDSLVSEWNSFMESTIDIKPVSTLLEKAKHDGILNNFQKNSSQFLLRLKSSYPIYADVNDILTGFVYSMKLGFELIGLQKQEDTYSSISWTIGSVDLTIPERLRKEFQNIKDFIKSYNVQSNVPEELLVFIIRICKLHGHKLNDVLQQSLEILYYRWSLRKMKEQQDETTQASLYKYSDPTDEIEGDFKELFPDYEDVLNIETEGSMKNDFNDIYAEIANLFVSDYEDSYKSILSTGGKVYTKLSSLSFGVGELNNSSFLTLVNALSMSYGSFQEVKDIDFYYGSSPVEMKKAIEIIKELQFFVLKLLSTWPEHATLQNISRLCHEFLDFPLNTPIARLLQKIETIYTYIAEWEKYASSEVTLKSQFDILTNLIVSWRKLELSTWKALFAHENESLQKTLGKWWFYLFETIIVSDNDIPSLFSALNIFMSQATYGEYSYRLSMLLGFIEICDEPETCQALENFVQFYKQFTPLVDEGIALKKKQLEKDINEVILLASWKDVNIDALKQSARRSHNNLYKIVRKYRSLLATPVKSLIESGLSYQLCNINNTTTPKLARVDADVEMSLIKEVKSWTDRPSRLKDISMIDSNMSVYLKKISDSQIPTLLDLANGVSQDMERLRKETPTELKKDNKKIIASLLVQKRKLLSDTLKELHRIGLKTSLRKDILQLSETISMILSNTKNFKDGLFEGVDGNFFKILDLLPRLRASISSPAEGVPPVDLEKGLAVAENLIFSLIATRNPLFEFSESMKKAEEYSNALELVTKSELTRASYNKSLKQNIDLVKSNLHWLKKLVSFIIETIDSSKTFTKSNVSTTIFSNLAAKADDLIYHSNNSIKLFSTMDDISLVENYNNMFKTFVNDLESWIVDYPSYTFVCSTIKNWIEINGCLHLDSNTSMYNANSMKLVEDVEISLRKLSNSIIYSVQKVTECSKDISTEDDKWMVDSQQQLMKLLKLTYHKKVVHQMSQTLEVISQVEHNSMSSNITRAMVKFTLPLVRHYFTLLSTILQKVRDNYYETSKSTYLLSNSLYVLATKGFCSPEPPTEQKQDDNLQDGTGLGDGDGATNNSKDVEEDEDLTEDAQQPNEEKDKDRDDEDENDDAVDIEGDMAGDLENASDQENDNEEEEGEEEELDEEIDDLDDLDPNAIDDKMWDEEAQEDSKEKESDKMPENSNADDDDMKANEDEDENSDNKQKPDTKDEVKEDENQEDQEGDDDEDGEDKDVGEQEDEVKNEENEELDNQVPEADALDLPEDMNLDSGDEKDDEGDESGEEFDDGMDVDENNNEGEEEDNKDADVDKEADAEEAEEAEEADEENLDAESEENKEEEEEEGSNDPEGQADEGETNEEPIEEDSDVEAVDGEKDIDEEGGNDGDDEEEQDKAEGVDGGLDENNNEKMDEDATVKQESGEKGDGADEQVMEENTDVGATGGASSEKQEDMEKNEEKTNDDARDSAKESLKQLGDSMKEFHRRRQEIQEAKREEENEMEDKANTRPDEFQHLEGENADFDTQALGAADQDQIQNIDEEKAIDDDIDDEVKHEEDTNSMDVDQKKGEEENQDEDVKEEIKEENNADFDGRTRGIQGGTRDQLIDQNELNIKTEMLDLSSDEEDADNFEVVMNTDDQIPPISIEESRDIWKKSEMATQELASGLCEQLRLILEPTLATKLRGDYKTGKRLNMKRIIPYIASDFRKDKIWLRRTKPSKRQYQIMIAIDDSKSMSESKSTTLAFNSISLVSKALTQLESGGLCIVRFGEDVKVVHPFDRPFNNQESGARIFQWFDFQQTRTDIKQLCKNSIKIFENARAQTSADLWQLQIILSDGVCEDHQTVQRLVREAREQKIMLVFVVIDGINKNESILDMSQVSYETDANTGASNLKVTKYLDTFPFEFYVIVRDINELPEMLSLILRQYFSEMASN